MEQMKLARIRLETVIQKCNLRDSRRWLALEIRPQFTNIKRQERLSMSADDYVITK